MLNYLQKIGRSLMVPIAVLPAAALLMGIGYWIDPSGTTNQFAALLTKSGGALIDNMGILFAVGLAFGMSKDKHGSAALTGLVAWLIVQGLMNPDNVALILGKDVADVPAAFGSANTQFIGILVGVISAEVYNRTYQVELNPALAFFSGRRFSAIVVSVCALILSVILYLTWPPIYNGLVAFGESVVSLGAVGAGIFGFLNRLLIPLGLHHALNSVFWFDVAGINDIPNYLDGNNGAGVAGVTGIYQAGFFPIMMFGLPAGAYAIYREALPSQKKYVGGIMLAGAVASFFTGVTEPLEFSFMFVAPPLYVIHALLTGLSLFIAAHFQWIAGFGFSAGLVDYILSFKNPMAVHNYMLIVQGLVFAAIYFFTFTFMIRKFNFLTPGRTEGEFDEVEVGSNAKKDYTTLAENLLAAIGEENLVEVNNCTTRLRLTVVDSSIYKEETFKQLGMLGVMKPAQNNLQLVVGPDVEFVAEALKSISHK